MNKLYNKEFIKGQLKLSKKQDNDERYQYLCSQFNAINYCINLERHTRKLQTKNNKLNKTINKALDTLESMPYEWRELNTIKSAIDILKGSDE